MLNVFACVNEFILSFLPLSSVYHGSANVNIDP